MIHRALIISESGLLLFGKQFLEQPQIRNNKILGPLISAMLVRTEEIIGVPITFISMANTSVAIVSNPDYKITCAVVYDQVDGEIFGKLIATELVESFCTQYGERLKEDEYLGNVGEFSLFNNRIGEAIKDTLQPILEWMAVQPGIHKAFLVSGDRILPNNIKVDHIAFISTYRSLLEQTHQIMAKTEEDIMEITLEAENKDISIQRIENRTLVIVRTTKGLRNPASGDQIKKSEKNMQRAVTALKSVLKLISTFYPRWGVTFEY